MLFSSLNTDILFRSINHYKAIAFHTMTQQGLYIKTQFFIIVNVYLTVSQFFK